MEAYTQAMKSIIKPGDCVLDIGTGTSILAFMELIVAPVQCTESYREVAAWQIQELGIDFSPIQNLAHYAAHQVSDEPVKLLSTPQTISSISYIDNVR